ncbi:hypothetical protein AAHB63_13960 [Bacillus thuringiensis]
MKLMEVNAEEFQNMKVKPSNYLIEKITESQHLIHREIAEYERDAFREETLFEYKGKSFYQKLRSVHLKHRQYQPYSLIGRVLGN